jgi:SAM-dependent methyltransferase
MSLFPVPGSSTVVRALVVAGLLSLSGAVVSRGDESGNTPASHHTPRHDSKQTHGGGDVGSDGRASASEHHHDSDDATIQHRFQDAEAWSDHFEDPARDLWQLPDSVVSVLVDRDDLVVLDIGSATGYFPVRFARRLAGGIVFGADIEPSMVFHLNDRARREGLDNLVSILAAPDDPHVPRDVDLVFLCNTYHHIGDRLEYFTRLQQWLRPGGRVAIIDYREDSRRGPPHKLSRDHIVREMRSSGYELAEEHTFLPEQYLLVFRVGTAD